ncbi:MAG: M14 family metallopeptidase [Gemmiger sp.]
MEINVTSLGLAVHEQLELRKNRLTPLPGNDTGKRICIVTGVHGDELEGQYVAYLLNRRLQAQPELLRATVDIYPAMNPLGINTIKRGVPLFDLDMNRIFPGAEDGPAVEYFARQAIEDMRGADIAIDIHASNIFLKELPQVRISEETAPALVPLAKQLNIDFVWVHAAATVLQSTLAHSLNAMGTKCLVVEMGVGMRLTKEYGQQLTEGILNLMRSQGMWDGETTPPRTPIVSKDEVAFLNANAAGIFMAQVRHNGQVKAGQRLGVIADPLTGQDKEIITAPVDGLLFTLREYPVVYPGSLLARILTQGGQPA